MLQAIIQTVAKPVIPKTQISARIPHARPPQARQQLDAEGKARRNPGCRGRLPKDDAGSFIAEREKSDVVRDLLAFLVERT
jgi:hypothetical protein